jgi:diguanylate cyclase (GGDEF)-like protein
MQSELNRVFEQLRNDLKLFVDLSFQESDDRWQAWYSSVESEIEVRCWEKKGCNKQDCPAHSKPKCRCWLVAGTMCGGEVQGVFAQKYKSCTECSVYTDAVYKDSLSETYEHLIVLVHSLRTKQEELRHLATRDTLTGLHNRNYFNIVMARELERINRHGGHLSIIFIDIDNFKYINDTYGHLHGDGVLRECAAILSRAMRSSDLLVRFGGDEFVIAMPETDCNEKAPLIDRIEKIISQWNSEYSSCDYRLSMSIGCSTLEKGKDLETVIGEADADMYRIKMSKRE